MGAGSGKTRIDWRLRVEKGGVDNPIDCAMSSEGEDAAPVAGGSGTGGEAVKTEKDEE